MREIMPVKTSMKRRILSISAVLGFGLSVASCVSLGSDPPPQLLTLASSQQAATGTVITSNVADAIVLETPEAVRAIDTTRVPVHINDTAIAYVESAYWSDKPARLFRTMLAETLTAQTGRLVLEQPDPSGPRGMMLSGNLLRFGYDQGLQSVVVRYDATMRIAGQPIRQKRFEAEERVYTVEANAVGSALNVAANKIANDVALWVKG